MKDWSKEVKDIDNYINKQKIQSKQNFYSSDSVGLNE